MTNWLLFGGIAYCIVALCLAVYFYRRKIKRVVTKVDDVDPRSKRKRQKVSDDESEDLPDEGMEDSETETSSSFGFISKIVGVGLGIIVYIMMIKPMTEQFIQTANQSYGINSGVTLIISLIPWIIGTGMMILVFSNFFSAGGEA